MPSRISVLVIALTLRCATGLLLADTSSNAWMASDRLLEAGFAERVAPSVSGFVVAKDGYVLYEKYAGRLSYALDEPRTTRATMYDLASLTKVLATTTAVAQLFQRGELSLNSRVSDILGSEFAARGKTNITIQHLLTHTSGFPPDPWPLYSDPTFGCPATSTIPAPLDARCAERVLQSLLNQALVEGVQPGEVYKYSDLSMITLAYVVGHLSRDLGLVAEKDLHVLCADTLRNEPRMCYFEAYVRLHILSPLRRTDLRFNPDLSMSAAIAPTWIEVAYRNQTLRGVVSDENAYAMGGISGHAASGSAIPSGTVRGRRGLHL